MDSPAMASTSYPLRGPLARPAWRARPQRQAPLVVVAVRRGAVSWEGCQWLKSASRTRLASPRRRGTTGPSPDRLVEALSPPRRAGRRVLGEKCRGGGAGCGRCAICRRAMAARPRFPSPCGSSYLCNGSSPSRHAARAPRAAERGRAALGGGQGQRPVARRRRGLLRGRGEQAERDQDGLLRLLVSSSPVLSRACAGALVVTKPPPPLHPAAGKRPRGNGGGRSGTRKSPRSGSASWSTSGSSASHASTRCAWRGSGCPHSNLAEQHL